MKTVNLPVTFEAYHIPLEISMIINAPGGGGAAHNVPLSSLPVEALEAIAEQFMKDLFDAAGKKLEL